MDVYLLSLLAYASSMYLFWQCPITKVIWRWVERWAGCETLNPQSRATVCSATSLGCDRHIDPGAAHPDCMGDWLERNRRLFQGKINNLNDVITSIRRSLESWRLPFSRS